MTIPIGREIWRKYEIDGVPSSGAHNPDKTQIMTWTDWWESMLGAGAAGLAYIDLASLNADLAHASNTSAMVYGDGTAACWLRIWTDFAHLGCHCR